MLKKVAFTSSHLLQILFLIIFTTFFSNFREFKFASKFRKGYNLFNFKFSRFTFFVVFVNDQQVLAIKN